MHCIPYEGNEHLLGTPSTPKDYCIMTNVELIKELQKSVDKYGELPLQIVYQDVNLIGEKIKVKLDQSCSKNGKAISIYTD